jgi:tRNA dimethylallyltransferase
MDKILIITGPTATGKSTFALDIARKFSGELVSADSRQVYIGADIVTGKDIPQGFIKEYSKIIWHNYPLTYYTDGNTRIWLTDVVHLDEPFNVSFWKECHDLITKDISSRGKLPIIVGGTGLYIKSLTQDLSHISVPFNKQLRESLSYLSASQLFSHLKNINSEKAISLNESDKHNPRRLIRAIEITEFNKNTQSPSPGMRRGGEGVRLIGLTAPKDFLKNRIIARIDSRLAAGASAEAAFLLSKYSPDLPGMSACGYPALVGANPRDLWITAETQYLKRQLTWFAKMPEIKWFDVSRTDWQPKAEKFIASCYNNCSVTQA